MKITNTYTLALILNEGKFSSVKAAKTLGFKSHDSLTRELCKDWGLGPVTDWSSLPPDGELLIDCTTVAKPYGPYIENVNWTYDSAEGKSVLGYTIILVLWVVGESIYVLDVIYPGGEKKNELFRELLREVKEAGLNPRRVLFDNGYAPSETLNLIHRFGWVYVCRMKCNRTFNGRRVDKHDFYGAKGRCGQLKGVKYRVQVVKDGDRYLATNELIPHTTASLKRLYGNRWVIETVFRDLKDVLHMKKCSSRNFKAQFNHVLACLEAYLYLRQAFPDKSVEAAQQEFLRRYQCPNCRPNLRYLLVA
jgi:Transposase DDE domain